MSKRNPNRGDPEVELLGKMGLEPPQLQLHSRLIQTGTKWGEAGVVLTDTIPTLWAPDKVD